MKVLVHEHITILGDEIKQEYPSIQAAAREMKCNPRHLSDQLKGKRKETETIAGKVTQIEAQDGKTNSTTSSVPEHTDHAKENPPLGAVAPGRSGTRFEQTMVKIAFAVEWFRSKF
jgi:hypothetical protein